MSFDNVPNDLKQSFKDAYKKQEQKAGKRGVAWELSLDEWCAFWLTCDRYLYRGRRRDQLCMARFGDTGPYSIYNIWAATNHENARLSTRGRPGRKWTAEYRARMTGRLCNTQKAVLTPLGRFKGIGEAARAHGIHRTLIARRANNAERSDYQWI